MVGPILGESVHATRAGLIKSGIEALNFRVVRTSKPISGMGTPQVVQGVKNCVVDGVIIMVNELTYIISALLRSLGIHCISLLTLLRRQVWKMSIARSCNAGTLEPQLTIRTTFWLSVNQVTDWACKDSVKAFMDKETASSSLKVELWDFLKSDQFWWTTLPSNSMKLPQAEADASE